MMQILQLIYFMLPAYLANLTPALFKNFLKNWNTPLDFNKKLHGKPILGINKTIKGTIIGISFAILTAYLQYKLHPNALSLIDYQNWLAIGFLQGFGALFGDALKSFFKRRFGIKPGKSWMPFDQTDYSIGALAFTSIIFFPGWANAILIVIVSAILHILANLVGYVLGIKKTKL